MIYGIAVLLAMAAQIWHILSSIDLVIKKAGIIGIWLVIWQIASSVTGLAFLLPGPVTVFLALGKAFVRVHFTGSFFTALFKISAGFLAALLAGLVLGSIAAVKKGVQSFLEPLVLFDEGSAGGSIYYCDADLVRFAECGGYDWIYGCISNGLSGSA